MTSLGRPNRTLYGRGQQSSRRRTGQNRTGPTDREGGKSSYRHLIHHCGAFVRSRTSSQWGLDWLGCHRRELLIFLSRVRANARPVIVQSKLWVLYLDSWCSYRSATAAAAATVEVEEERGYSIGAGAAYYYNIGAPSQLEP